MNINKSKLCLNDDFVWKPVSHQQQQQLHMQMDPAFHLEASDSDGLHTFQIIL